MADDPKMRAFRDMIVGVIVASIIFSLAQMLTEGNWEAFIASGLEIGFFVLAWFAYDQAQTESNNVDDDEEEKPKR